MVNEITKLRVNGVVMGTCLSEAQIAYVLDIPEDDVLELLLDYNIERCIGCEWWFDSGELTCDKDDFTGYCSECRHDLGVE